MAILAGMTIPTVKATYSLDGRTVEQLEQLARRWRVSKSEVIRRVVDDAANKAKAADLAVAALDRLQSAASLNREQIAAWQAKLQKERRSTTRGQAT